MAAVSSVFAASSNLQLMRRNSLLRNFQFQQTAFSVVRTAPLEGSHVRVPEQDAENQEVAAFHRGGSASLPP